MASMATRFCGHIVRRGSVAYLARDNIWKNLKCTLKTYSPLNGHAIKVNMPVLSPTMESGTIVKWYKKEGDSVNAGDLICDIQTDKAVVGFDIEEDGTLAKILQPENEQIKVGALIALIVEEGGDWKQVEIPVQTETDTTSLSSSTTNVLPTSDVGSYVRGIGPAVRSLLDVYKLRADDVTPTGPNGRLLKGDVLQHIKQTGIKPAPVQTYKPPSQPPTLSQSGTPSQPPTLSQSGTPLSTQPSTQTTHATTQIEQQLKSPGSQLQSKTKIRASSDFSETEEVAFSDIPVSGMRKVIAKRLTESKTTIPHSYSVVDCNMQNVLKLRTDLLNDGMRVSVNDFVIKAAAVALQRVPEVNAIWTGSESRVLPDIDISVAVATGNGLITPIVKDAISLGLQDISATVRNLAIKAREGKLQLHEFQGGSFTISNLGMYGIKEFSAVINPPQSCILAVGASRLTLNSDGAPQTTLTVTLSADSRIVDDVLAVKFLDAFRETIEEPMSTLNQTVAMEKVFNK